jgi:hypothetical protein
MLSEISISEYYDGSLGLLKSLKAGAFTISDLRAGIIKNTEAEEARVQIWCA